MKQVDMEVILEVDTGSPIGQCRAAPVCLGPGAPGAVLAVYGADFDVDPYIDMFFFPRDTLKMVLFDGAGKVVWKRDLGAPVAAACKFMDRPGEQTLAYYPDGKLRVWADKHAEDREAAVQRYGHPFYRAAMKFTSTGWNNCILGGI